MLSDYQALIGKRVSIVERSPSDLGLSFVGWVQSVAPDGKSMVLRDVHELLSCPPAGTRVRKVGEMDFGLDKYEVRFIVDQG
jgi:hypothetical protein